VKIKNFSLTVNGYALWGQDTFTFAFIRPKELRQLKGNHRQVGKGSGKTSPIERYWATLRARITRYVSVKASLSHENSNTITSKLFTVNYNQKCINTF
jgi:hypothetical protein